MIINPKLYKMEFTFSPALMQELMEQGIKNVENQDFCFISSEKDKELANAIQEMEAIGVTGIKVDYSLAG